MSLTPIHPIDSEPLLRRLRRMGLVLTGDQTLADGILRDAFLRARGAFDSPQDVSHQDVFKLGFDAYDDAVHKKGVVVILGRAGRKSGTLEERVNALSYVERVAIALLLVEEMSPRAGAILSGRPAVVLEDALAGALMKLENTTNGNDNDWQA